MLSACHVFSPPPGENFPDAPTIILNGIELDVYTSHYRLYEDYVEVPLKAFLTSIGAEYAESPLNEYHIQCYSLKNRRFIVNWDMDLFMLEEDYLALLQKLEGTGLELTKEIASNHGLLPSISGVDSMWPDHISLMNALHKSGIDITIEYDYEARTITVTLP
jgi:hypothetical protein